MKNKPRKLPINLILAAILGLTLLSLALGFLGVINLTLVGFILAGLAGVSLITLIVGGWLTWQNSKEYAKLQQSLALDQGTANHPILVSEQPGMDKPNVDESTKNLEEICQKYPTFASAKSAIEKIVMDDRYTDAETIFHLLQAYPDLLTVQLQMLGTGYIFLFDCVCINFTRNEKMTGIHICQDTIEAFLKAGAYTESAHQVILQIKNPLLIALFDRYKPQPQSKTQSQSTPSNTV